MKVALASLPPAMMVSPTGEATGFSVELQNLVLNSMGLPALTPMLTGWDAMIPGLQAHQFDYVGAGITITEARCRIVVYSAPYYAARLALYVPPGNPKHLTSILQVAQRSDVKLATLPGQERAYAVKQGVKPDHLLLVPDHQAVTGGRVDAFIAGQFTIPVPEKMGLALVIDEQSPVSASGIAFRKDDIRFRDAFNEHLLPLIRNGVIQKLYAKYGAPNGDAVASLVSKFTRASDVVPECD